MSAANTVARLDRLLRARSVAIVGASDKPGALGNAVLRNLDRHGFAGAIHLINPKRDTIDGRPCLASIDDLPEGVDAAVLAIPAGTVIEAVRALARRGVGAAVIFSAGFAEGGDDGIAAQAELARIAAETGMVIEGPNCLGLVNFVDGLPLTFVETPLAPLAAPGIGPGIGIVSQSGAMAVVLGTTLAAKELGLSFSISTGNEAATGVEDYVEVLIDDPHTAVIGMIVEQFRSPRRFRALARRATEAGKPIVLLHPGTSHAARESAATHTGAMAGDWLLMKTLVERAGVLLVETLEELGDVLDLVRRWPRAPAGGAVVLTESGAFKALALDLAERVGLPLAALGDATHDALRATIPDFVLVSNPMDLTAQTLVDPDIYRRTLTPLLADPGVASIMLGIIQTDAATASRKFGPIIATLAQLAPETPVLFAGLDDGAPVPTEHLSALRGIGVPYFPSPDRAIRALQRVTTWASRDRETSQAAPIAIELGETGVIPEHRAKALLAPLGLRFPAGGFAASLDEAKAAAAWVGYPVALKAQAAALSHKSDAGGVVLAIADEAGLAAAWRRLHADVAAHDATIALDGVLVEAMAAPGAEFIVGARHDPDWGPIVLAGFGGVTAELLGDVRLLPADLTHAGTVAELRRLKMAPLLDGYRGAPALDIDAVATLIGTLGRLLAGTPAIREIDLNPVIVGAAGTGCVALDALIVAG